MATTALEARTAGNVKPTALTTVRPRLTPLPSLPKWAVTMTVQLTPVFTRTESMTRQFTKQRPAFTKHGNEKPT